MLALNAVKQIFDILRNGTGVGVPFTELPPRRIEKVGAVLIFINNVKLVDKQMGTLSLFPVCRNTVEHSVGDRQKSGRL